jgi:ABC-type nitrate/sulfonate/bicarbonate transport system permease component
VAFPATGRARVTAPGGVERRGRRVLSGFLLRWTVFAATVAAWQLVTAVAVPEDEKVFFPPPSVIGRRMYELWLSGPAGHGFLTPAVTADIVPSVERMLAGWLLAAVLGVGLGLLLGRLPRVLDYVDLPIQFGRAIPPPALIPVFIVLLKLGPAMRVAVIVFGVVWPILLNSIDGARTVEPLRLDVARVFTLTPWQRLRGIIVPAAGPKIFAGLRISLSMSIILMVISEMVGGTDGIGYRLFTAKDSFQLPDMWSVIVLLGLLGYTFNALLLALERHVLFWHRGERRVAA